MWMREGQGHQFSFWRAFWIVSVPLLWVSQSVGQLAAPGNAGVSIDARIERLSMTIDRAQQQMETSRQQLEQAKQELQALRQELATGEAAAAGSTATSAPVSPSSKAAEQSTNSMEQEAMQNNQIATLDQIKVESASRYPVRLTGSILLNGFVNTGRVDQAAAPTAALGGSGSTGISVQQTVLGVDADGPHLFGAESHADVRTDFFGNPGSQGYSSGVGLLRLRTAHAALDWNRTKLFFSLDRPIISPNSPESLVAVAEPELAWSGNLWSWNPQVGITHTLGTATRLRLQAALIDPADPYAGTAASTTSTTLQQVTTLAEASRRPGTEARIAVLGRDDAQSLQFGAGGYFSPHHVTTGAAGGSGDFDGWAGTLDFRAPLSHGLVLSASAYRGQGLGGLGAGGYKDYVLRSVGTSLSVRALDDVGGWAQLHQSISQQITWNAGFGMDNAFSAQLRDSTSTSNATLYGNIARNRTAFANVIYSPRAYLRLSVEYRNLFTAPSPGPVWRSNVTGVGAAYRF